MSFVDRLGGTSIVYFDFPKAAMSLTAEMPGYTRAHPGDVMTLAVPPTACYLFDAEGLAFARPPSGQVDRRAA